MCVLTTGAVKGVWWVSVCIALEPSALAGCAPSSSVVQMTVLPQIIQSPAFSELLLLERILPCKYRQRDVAGHVIFGWVFGWLALLFATTPSETGAVCCEAVVPITQAGCLKAWLILKDTSLVRSCRALVHSGHIMEVLPTYVKGSFLDFDTYLVLPVASSITLLFIWWETEIKIILFTINFLQKIVYLNRLRTNSLVSFTWFKTGYITVYRVIETTDVVSASFFMSSVVIFDQSMALHACACPPMPVSLHSITRRDWQNGSRQGPEEEDSKTGEQAGRDGWYLHHVYNQDSYTS